jgi:ADP-heptose:LPS heptosyltransferase
VSTTRALRAQRFDVAIDLMGSDHASTAAWLSGAKRRLVRRPGPRRKRFAWRWFATDLIESPFGQERMYLQRWHCLQQAGIRSAAPSFELLPGPPLVPLLGAEAEGEEYIHLSPFTKHSRKELPPTQLVDLLLRLREARGDLRLAISCSGQERERRALDALLHALPFAPWRTFAGTLDIPQLHALIGGAALHLGGDTASMHLAWLADTPSVCWMSAFASHRTWAPEGERHEMVYSNLPPGEHLLGVSTEAIVARSLELLRAAAAPQSIGLSAGSSSSPAVSL